MKLFGLSLHLIHILLKNNVMSVVEVYIELPACRFSPLSMRICTLPSSSAALSPILYLSFRSSEDQCSFAEQ